MLHIRGTQALLTIIKRRSWNLKRAERNIFHPSRSEHWSCVLAIGMVYIYYKQLQEE